MDLRTDIREEFEEHLNVEKVFNKVFYRYMDIDGAIHTLGNKTLKFTNPKEFNDPLDCHEGLINVKYTSSELKEAIKKYVHPRLQGYKRGDKRKVIQKYFDTPSKWNEFQLQGIMEKKEKIGICCFSEIKDNILMWSHYGKNHTGVCIGFKILPMQEELYGLYPVKYCDRIKVIDKNVDARTALFHWVLTKATDWSYEREVRAVNMDESGIVDLDPLAVTEIYYGCKISSSDKLKLDNIIKADFKHANKYQMVIDNNSFKLKALELKF